jgi:hypothetical protein
MDADAELAMRLQEAEIVQHAQEQRPQLISA